MLLLERTSDKTTSNRIVLDFNGIIDLSDNTLFELCARNRDLRIERNKEGKLIIMLPVGSETGKKEGVIFGFLFIWNRKNRLGEIFSSSTGFTLANGAVRSPDAAFITKEKWQALAKEDRKKFARICPDFIVELRSESDNLTDVKEKVEEWMANGCRLAWLIDPKEEKVYVYRKGAGMNTINSFQGKLDGEDVLPGFEFELTELKYNYTDTNPVCPILLGSCRETARI